MKTKNSIMKFGVILMVLIFPLFLMGCAGDDDAAAPGVSSVSGSAVKGPIDGATVTAYYFDATNGQEVELVAQNAPVTTDATGAYTFNFNPSDLQGITSPLIVRTVGGTMGGQTAPQLEAVVADPTTLATANNTINSHLSAASSVAAGLLKKAVQAAGAAQTTAQANAIVTQVETAFNVDLSEDPATSGTGVASLNDSVDQNFDLIHTPANNDAVDDLIDYLVADLSSTTGIFDGTVDDPASPGTDTTSPNMSSFGDGNLAVLLPNGGSDFLTLSLSTDTTSIGDNGIDAATLTATLNDGTGSAVADGTTVSFTITTGTGTLSAPTATTTSGQAQVTLASDTAGTIVVSAGYTLANGNPMTRQVTITVADCQEVAGVTLSSDKTAIMNDGADAATITAALTAVCAGSTVPDDTTVNFTITAGTGTLLPSTGTTATINGQAQVTLTSTEVGTVTVQASAGAYTDTVDVGVITDPCDPADPAVTASPTTIIISTGTSTITATVPAADPANCAAGVADATTVDFSVTPDGIGTISDVTTTTNGVATATLTAGSTAGTATVTATVTDSQGTAHSGTVDVGVIEQPTAATVTVSISGTGSDGIAGASIAIQYPANVTFTSATVTGTIFAPISPMVTPNNVTATSTVTTGIMGSSEVTEVGSVLILTFGITSGTVSQSDFTLTSASYVSDLGQTVTGFTTTHSVALQ